MTLNNYFVRCLTFEAISIDTRQGVKKPADVNSIEVIVSLYINSTIACNFVISWLLTVFVVRCSTCDVSIDPRPGVKKSADVNSTEFIVSLILQLLVILLLGSLPAAIITFYNIMWIISLTFYSWILIQ